VASDPTSLWKSWHRAAVTQRRDVVCDAIASVVLSPGGFSEPGEDLRTPVGSFRVGAKPPCQFHQILHFQRMLKSPDPLKDSEYS